MYSLKSQIGTENIETWTCDDDDGDGDGGNAWFPEKWKI